MQVACEVLYYLRIVNSLLRIKVISSLYSLDLRNYRKFKTSIRISSSAFSIYSIACICMRFSTTSSPLQSLLLHRYIANPGRRSRVRVFVVAGKQQVPVSANRRLLL